MGVAQFGAVADAVEVADEAPGAIERLGCCFQGGKGIEIVECVGILNGLRELINGGLSALKGVFYIRFNCGGSEFSPLNLKIL